MFDFSQECFDLGTDITAALDGIEGVETALYRVLDQVNFTNDRASEQAVMALVGSIGNFRAVARVEAAKIIKSACEVPL